MFMLFYYRLAGFNALISIAVNLIILLGLMAYLGATMTLPGIAGFILTIGMGVDSNVLIFERIKEELATGKGVKQAVAAGLRSRVADHSRHARRVADFGGVPLQLRHRPDSRLRDDAHDRPARQRVHGRLRVAHLVRADPVAPHRSRSCQHLDLWHLFENANFDFIKWRWHAIALSALVILAGVA